MKRCMGCMEEYPEQETSCPFCQYEEGTDVEEGRFITPNTIISERYVIGRVLGSGGFGITYIAWDEWLHLKVAIKEYFPVNFCSRARGQINVEPFGGQKGQDYRTGLKKAIEEARRLARFNRLASVVEVYNCFEANETFYIVMEYLEGENLSEVLARVGKISARESIGLILPVVKSLQKIHEDGIIHRDIAPDNIFVTKEGRVVLLDLGAARYLANLQDKSNQSKIPVKDGYSPIEQYIDTKEQGSFTDVYSVGATLYRMITGHKPENSLIRRAMGESNDLEPISKYCNDIDTICDDAIKNALKVNVEDRTNDMKTLLEELQSSNLFKNSDYNREEHIKRLFQTVVDEEDVEDIEDDDMATVFADESECANLMQDVVEENINKNVEQNINEDVKDIEENVEENIDKGVKDIEDIEENIKDIEDIEENIDEVKDIEDIEENVNEVKDIENIEEKVEYVKDIENIEEKVEDIKDIEKDVKDIEENVDEVIDRNQNSSIQGILPGGINEQVNVDLTLTQFNNDYDADVHRWVPEWTDDTHEFVYFGTYPQNELPESEINDEIVCAYYGMNKTSNVRGIRYKRIGETDVARPVDELWNGGDYKFFKYEPLKWRVLRCEDNVLMLITDSVIDCKKYHGAREEVSWDDCSLKQWLNEIFSITAFDKYEAKFLKKIDVKVGLLSLDEAKEYFENEADRYAKGTQYALCEGLWKDSKKETSWWWLRSDKAAYSAKINTPYEGYKDGAGVNVVNTPDGVRPVIYVNIVEQN